MISFDNTASVGIALDDELHNFDLEKCGTNFLSSQGCTWSKIELEESERESTEISRGRWWSSSESAKVSPSCHKNHALTDPTRNSFSRLIFIALK